MEKVGLKGILETCSSKYGAPVSSFAFPGSQTKTETLKLHPGLMHQNSRSNREFIGIGVLENNWFRGQVSMAWLLFDVEKVQGDSQIQTL